VTVECILLTKPSFFQVIERGLLRRGRKSLIGGRIEGNGSLCWRPNGNPNLFGDADKIKKSGTSFVFKIPIKDGLGIPKSLGFRACRTTGL